MIKVYFKKYYDIDMEAEAVAIVEKDFWEKNKCLDDRTNIKVDEVFNSLDFYEAMESIYDVSDDFNEEDLIEAGKKAGIEFANNPEFSDFVLSLYNEEYEEDEEYDNKEYNF